MTEEQSERPERRFLGENARTWAILGALLAVAVVVTIFQGSGNDAADERAGPDRSAPESSVAAATDLERIYGTCATNAGARLRELGVSDAPEALMAVGDAGGSLTVSKGSASDSANEVVAGCVLGGIGATDSLVSRIQTTTALMGRQSEEINGYELSWSFSPDSGLSLIVED